MAPPHPYVDGQQKSEIGAGTGGRPTGAPKLRFFSPVPSYSRKLQDVSGFLHAHDENCGQPQAVCMAIMKIADFLSAFEKVSGHGTTPSICGWPRAVSQRLGGPPAEDKGLAH